MLFFYPATLSGTSFSASQSSVIFLSISSSSFVSGAVSVVGNTTTGAVFSLAFKTNNLATIFPPDMFTFLFGANATQSINHLTINKADLIGLTAHPSNTAESLLIGIIGRILIGKNNVFTPKIDFNYWGYGINEGMRTDTVLIKFNRLLAITDTYEINDTATPLTPTDF
jgi:hypothetical protein